MIRTFVPPMLAASLAAMLLVQPAEARTPRVRGAVSSESGETGAVRRFAFSEGAVYTVPTAPGRVTAIALEPGEVLGAVASGDTARWVIGDTTSGAGEELRAHVLVKPVAAGLATNLVVTTDRRTYHLQLTSRAAAPAVAVSWTYPADALLALRAPGGASPARPQAGVLAVSLDRLRFDYTLSGDKPAWRPLRVFDDGRQTYIEFPPSLTVGQAPPLFLIGSDGGSELVNYRLVGRHYVVDRLFDAAELRLGARKPRVVRIRRAGAGKPAQEKGE